MGNEKSILHRYATEFPAIAFIYQAYYLLYIFCLPKINKNRNIKVCSTIPLSKKLSHVENSKPICSSNQFTGSYMAKAPGKKKFSDNYSTHTKYKVEFS